MVLIQEKILEKLKCFQCSEYLCYSPIYINENGDSFCAKCCPETGKYSINKAYIHLAAMMEFPCRYVKDGCLKVLVWNEAEDHEGDCGYKKIPCPICDCESEISNFFEHYQTCHSNSIVENTCIYKIDITKETELNFLTKIGDLIFLIRIQNSISANSIDHSVRLLKNTETNSKYKFILNFDQNSETILTKTKIISPQTNFEQNPENVLSLSINGLGAIFGNLQNIISTFTVKRFLIHCSQCKEIITDFVANDESSDMLCDACKPVQEHMKECSKKIHGCNYVSEEQYMAKHKQWFCRYVSDNCKFCKSAYDKMSKIEHLKICNQVILKYSTEVENEFCLNKRTFLEINVYGELFYSFFYIKSKHLSIYVMKQKGTKNEGFSVVVTILSGNFKVKNKKLETSNDENYWQGNIEVGNLNDLYITLIIQYRKLTNK